MVLAALGIGEPLVRWSGLVGHVLGFTDSATLPLLSRTPDISVGASLPALPFWGC